MAQARDDLRGRESTIDSCIESVERDDATSQPGETATEAHERVRTWLATREDLTAVAWTGLQSNFLEKRGSLFSIEEAIAYIQELIDTKRADRAREYFQRAPRAIRTHVRGLVEAEFAWCPTGPDNA